MANVAALPRRRKPDRVPVLIIEDNADQWLIIRAALAQCFPEIEPIWANNTPQALRHLEGCAAGKTKLPRLILLDLYIPTRETAWAFLDALKAHSLYRQVPVVVLSHSQQDQDIATSYAHSVASYIVKPVTYHQWLTCFYTFRRYWWESVTLLRQEVQA